MAGDGPPAASPPGAPGQDAAPVRPPGTMTHTDGTRGSSQPPVLAAHELECQICYSRYDARARRPKLLRCGHRLCARCLRKMVALGDASPRRLCCPFCRRQSPVPGGDAQWLQDDSEGLVCRERAQKRGPPATPEVLLCPSVLEPLAEPSPSSDCLVVTILEVPEDVVPPEGLGGLDVVQLYRPSSPVALPSRGPAPKGRSWTWRAAPRCLLGTLCLLYCSSLPFGIYLLLTEHHSLGAALVSLLPASLLLCISYSLCQCLCREVFAFPSS